MKPAAPVEAHPTTIPNPLLVILLPAVASPSVLAGADAAPAPSTTPATRDRGGCSYGLTQELCPPPGGCRHKEAAGRNNRQSRTIDVRERMMNAPNPPSAVSIAAPAPPISQPASFAAGAASTSILRRSAPAEQGNHAFRDTSWSHSAWKNKFRLKTGSSEAPCGVKLTFLPHC